MAADDNAALLNMIARRYMTPPFHVSTALRRSGSEDAAPDPSRRSPLSNYKNRNKRQSTITVLEIDNLV
jgi:hypothetical protein